MKNALENQLPLSQLRKIIKRALAEDIGSGDITTAAMVEARQQGQAVIIAKAPGIIAGLPVARETFLAIAPELEFKALVCDGKSVKANTKIATIAGPLAAILTAERTALNCLMRMSGIATLTSQFVQAVSGTQAKIIDTRKTAPGLRLLDKYAVRAGGGGNHRFGLSDGILIKENHIRAAGSITQAVVKARAHGHHLLKIEVEVTNLQELKEALTAGAEAILLDNMTPAQLAKSVKLIAGRAICEASGGITLQNVRAIAETGVNLISIGRLTHSAPALDLSLLIQTMTS